MLFSVTMPRLGGHDSRGDVLVLESGENLIGVAVDKVRAVVDSAEISQAGGSTEELPSYVLEVLRGASGAVFLVDLPAMVESARRSVS